MPMCFYVNLVIIHLMFMWEDTIKSIHSSLFKINKNKINTNNYKKQAKQYVKCCMFKFYYSIMYCPSMWFDVQYRDIYEETENCLQQRSQEDAKLVSLFICNNASEMFVNFTIPSFYDLLQKIVFSCKSGIQESGNSLVNDIVKSFLP